MKNIYFVNYTCYNERSQAITDYIIENFDDKLVMNPKQADLIVCVGGDGTLIKAVHDFRKFNVPIYGINAGTVGFLMNTLQEDEIDYIFSGEFNPTTISVNMMKVRINSNYYYAFNEVMVGGNMNSWVNFELTDCDDLVGEVDGGGLIFSTPQGSTGINKNNGGPILPLESNLWSITGDKVTRKISHVVGPRTIVVKCKSREPVRAWIDGNVHHFFGVETVILSESDETVDLAFSDAKAFLKKRRETR